MKLTFLGATQTVTGSKFLLEDSGVRILVDCGLFQGLKEFRLKNWRPFPVDPASLNAVLLTHAHIDHSGYLPVLFKNGFSGPVYCTPGTRDLCEILLPDAGYLQEEEARFANRHGFSKHRPALPLFTYEDAKNCLKHFKTVEFNAPLHLGEALKIQWIPVGHIIGASYILVQNKHQSLVFTGDVGRPDDILMNPPHPIKQADYLVVESTYGNRRHSPSDPWEDFEGMINTTIKRGGIVLVPSFAVGRAQHILKVIMDLKAAGKIPNVPVYLNSPMAIRATEVFCDHLDDHRLDENSCKELCRVAKFVTSVEHSKALTQKTEPAVIISSSGMATGGRVLHHLKSLVTDKKNTVVFVGFQAAGTRGEALIGGVDQIKIHGNYYPVRAEIRYMENLSAHADGPELIEWLKQMNSSPKRTFIVHGEPAAQDAMRRNLADFLHWESQIPKYGESVDLN